MKKILLIFLLMLPLTLMACDCNTKPKLKAVEIGTKCVIQGVDYIVFNSWRSGRSYKYELMSEKKDISVQGTKKLKKLCTKPLLDYTSHLQNY